MLEIDFAVALSRHLIRVEQMKGREQARMIKKSLKKIPKKMNQIDTKYKCLNSANPTPITLSLIWLKHSRTFLLSVKTTIVFTIRIWASECKHLTIRLTLRLEI
jgi:hypothetical protein